MDVDLASPSNAAAPSPRRRIYRGWVVLTVAAFAMVATLPGRTQGLGLITVPLLADLDLSEVAFARLNVIATLVGALFVLPTGLGVDRIGVRVVLAATLASLGAVVLAMTGAHGAAALLLAVTLTRGLGQSALSLVSLATVGKWFTRRASVAMGVYSLVLGFGFIAAFPGVQYAVERAGWRPAWTGVGLSILTLAPVAWWIVRDGPAPDELAVEGVPETATDARDGSRASLRAALGSPSFWAYALGSALYALVAAAVSLLNELVLRERGFGTATFRVALATTALAGILSNFVGGWIGQRYSLPRVLAVGLALFAPCLLLFPHARTETHVVLWALGMGATGGVVTVVFFAIWARHFARANLGSVQGVAQGLTVLASAAGPALFAEVHARTGSYASAFRGTALLSLLFAAACWVVPPPPRSGSEAR
jgi:MFS family permease